jgi:hypothetical protein
MKDSPLLTLILIGLGVYVISKELQRGFWSADPKKAQPGYFPTETP